MHRKWRKGLTGILHEEKNWVTYSATHGETHSGSYWKCKKTQGECTWKEWGNARKQWGSHRERLEYVKVHGHGGVHSECECGRKLKSDGTSGKSSCNAQGCVYRKVKRSHHRQNAPKVHRNTRGMHGIEWVYA